MTPNIQVGTILIEDRPLVTRILDLGSESYSAKWVGLKVLNQKLRSMGWNCSFTAEKRRQLFLVRSRPKISKKH